MDYKTLKQEEMDDAVISFYKAQEMDLYLHNINKQRYEAMLETLPEGKFRDRVQGLLDETNSRIAEVEAILVATVPQLPQKEAIASSLARLEQKEVR